MSETTAPPEPDVLALCRVVGSEPIMEHKGVIRKCFSRKKQFAAFYDIPYAAKPLGVKRFKAPEPLTSAKLKKMEEAGPSTSTSSVLPTPADVKPHLEGFKPAIQSPNVNIGSMDCLYLNVFTPKDPNEMDELLPVLVFIHGGGFTEGSSHPTRISARHIVQFGVVFVTLNYRLGPFGFLNLRTEEITGNVGLKDQVQALKWIRDNIKCFKGDPENVTISGWSAGATSVNLHLISPMSQGLFHKAIVQSGGIFFPWGYKGHHFEEKNTIKNDEEFQNLIHDETKSKELCKRVYELLCKARIDRHWQLYSSLYGPVTEKFKEGAFLPEDIEVMMMKAQPNVPVMAGITTNEALLVLLDCKVDMLAEWCTKNDVRLKRFLMDNLRWSEETAAKHVEKIRDKYFPPGLISNKQDAYHCFMELLHDIYIRRFYDGFKFGPKKKVHDKLFVYRFDHASELSAAMTLKKTEEYKCPLVATHGDDVEYLYRQLAIIYGWGRSIYPDEDFRSSEILNVMEHLCSLWANFCKTGVPKSDYGPPVQWKPHTEEKGYYLSIDKELVLKEGSLINERCDWLNRLVKREPTIQSQKVTPEEESAMQT